MKAVIVENISKIFPQGKKAVNHVTFSIEPGEIYGFLGPNGAGKTTTVKLLNGMLAPSEGGCRVFDLNPAEVPDKVHQLAGVITEHAQMYSHLSGLDNLIYYGSLFGLSSQDSRTRAVNLLDQLELSGARDQKLAAYSTGMRQRLSLARAMIHRPSILFLDEPTSGLDPESAQNVNTMIRKLAAEEGTTVFLCTHQLRYAQEICDTYGLIDDGELLAAGGLDDLRRLISAGMTATMHVNGQIIETAIESEADIPALVNRHVQRGDSIYHVSSRKLSLEEIYFTLTRNRDTRKEMSL